jgi:hypothetical protein
LPLHSLILFVQQSLENRYSAKDLKIVPINDYKTPKSVALQHF